MRHTPAVQSFTTLSVVYDEASATIRPVTAEADAFFGLELGTNGSGPAVRRALAESTVPQGVAVRWVRAKGGAARGLTLVPSERSEQNYSNPWGISR